MQRAAVEINSAIEDVVRRQFDGTIITRVDVQEGEDHDGDSALFVRVIFEGKPADLNGKRLKSITRFMRARLFEMGENRFPYTRIIASSEFDEAAA